MEHIALVFCVRVWLTAVADGLGNATTDQSKRDFKMGRANHAPGPG
jgi:hypothetical protein